MPQLTQGMFGTEFKRQSNLFGLSCGQMRSVRQAKNAGWYNAAGEKLGFGDLSTEDLLRVADQLEEGELFVVLNEQDSFWKFVDNPGPLGSLAQTKPEEQAPGKDYIAEKCVVIVQKGRLNLVCDDFAANHELGQLWHLTRGTAQLLIGSDVK